MTSGAMFFATRECAARAVRVTRLPRLATGNHKRLRGQRVRFRGAHALRWHYLEEHRGSLVWISSPLRPSRHFHVVMWLLRGGARLLSVLPPGAPASPERSRCCQHQRVHSTIGKSSSGGPVCGGTGENGSGNRARAPHRVQVGRFSKFVFLHLSNVVETLLCEHIFVWQRELTNTTGS